MLTIESLSGELADITRPKDVEETETLEGELSLSFTSLMIPNNPGHELLASEALVHFNGREFRIKQLTGPENRLTVHAISTFFDTAGNFREETQGGTVALQDALTFAMQGTDWTVDAPRDAVLLPNFGNDNSVALVKRACAEAGAEFQIMPGRVLKARKPLGTDRGAEYRHRHNIRSLTRTFDTSAMRMKIRGYGGEGLQVTYTSPNAAKFPHLGEADPVRDERFTIPASLVEYVKGKLQDVPRVSYDVDPVELGSNTPVDIGDPVWLVHEPLGIEFQVRVQEVVRTLDAAQQVKRVSVTLGNTVVKDLNDDLTQQKVEIDENAKQTQSRFEQTNEQFQLEVTRLDGEIIEAQTLIQTNADQILLQALKNTEQDQDIIEARAAITVEADLVRTEVVQQITDAKGEMTSQLNASIDVLAGQINSKAEATTVSALGTRVNTVEFNMNAPGGIVSQKVSQTDYNGQTISSLINQSAHLVEISAQAIQLTGIVRVADSLELGYSGNGATKAIKFNGQNAWIYSGGDFSLTLDATSVKVEGELYAYSRGMGLRNAPVITGATYNQALSLSLSPAGVLNVIRPDGTSVQFTP